MADDYVLQLQDDSKLILPVPQDTVYQAAPNPNMNLYWVEYRPPKALMPPGWVTRWVLKTPISLLKVNR